MIIYATICRSADAVVLSDHCAIGSSATKENVSQLTSTILENLRDSLNKTTLPNDGDSIGSSSTRSSKNKSKRSSKLLTPTDDDTPPVLRNGERKTFAYHRTGFSGGSTETTQNEDRTSRGDGSNPFQFDRVLSQFLEACSDENVYHQWWASADNGNSKGGADDWTGSNDSILDTASDFYFHVYLKDDLFFTCLGDDPDRRDQKVYVYRY
jgi:hypothetical protein